MMDWPQMVVLGVMALGVGGHLTVALIVSLGGTLPAPKPKNAAERWGAFLAKAASGADPPAGGVTPANTGDEND